MSDDLSPLDEFLKLRETLAGFVAGLVADGFTDAQARDLVVSMWVQIAKTPTPPEAGHDGDD